MMKFRKYFEEKPTQLAGELEITHTFLAQSNR